MNWNLSGFADEADEAVDIQIETLQKAGMNHVDLRSVDSINIVELPVDHAKQVQEKLQGAGIKVGMYGSPIGKIDLADDFEIDVKRLKHLGEMKKVFGCEAVRLFSYYNKEEVSEQDWQNETVRRLGELSKIASDLGLVLYHENECHIFGDTIERVSVLRDELRSKYDSFRMIFDFDNYNQAMGEVWSAWEAFRDTTDAIHFKESRKMDNGEFMHVPVGDGDGHVLKIMQELADRKWEGPITLEPHLAHSPAVMKTGPSGHGNQALADMTPQEVWLVAAEAAKKLMDEVKHPA